MKKLAFYMLMLVMGIGYAHAQGQADIKFDKTTHNFGTFSESSPVVSCHFHFHQRRRCSAGNSSGSGILRMYSARIYAGACNARKERNNQDYLQRYGQIPRTLQEVHYVAQQCQDRNAPALCGRRHDCQRRQIIVFMIQNKGEFFNSPFFAFFEAYNRYISQS